MKLQVYFQLFYHIEIGAYTTQLRHPDILSRLRAEADASICQDASIASPDQAKFPYLSMVLKEVYNNANLYPGHNTDDSIEEKTVAGEFQVYA